MSEEYIVPEETTLDQMKREKTIEQLFCGALKEEDAAYLYEQGVRNIKSGLTDISDAHLVKFSEKFAQEDLPRSDEVEDDPLISDNHYTLYNAYRLLRAEGFTHEDVVKLCESVASGQLEALLSAVITQERAIADEFVENLEDVGVHLGKAQGKYAEAFKQLNSGNDNLVSQASKLKALGLKNKKELPTGRSWKDGGFCGQPKKISG